MFSRVASSISGNMAQLAAQAYGLASIFGGDKKKRKKSLFGGLLAGVLGVVTGGWGFTMGNFLTGAGIAGALNFDNPINDTAAVRSGSDFARLFASGADSQLGRLSPVQAQQSGSSVQEIHNHISPTTYIGEVGSDVDIDRISDNIAWTVTQRLKVAT